MNDLKKNYIIEVKKKKSFFKPVICHRNFIVTNTLLGFKAKVYNGKSYSMIFLRNKMLNHKLGEFSITKIMGSAIAARKRAKQKKAMSKSKK